MKTYASIDNSHRSADISFFEKAEEGKAWFSYVANTGRLIVIIIGYLSVHKTFRCIQVGTHR